MDASEYLNRLAQQAEDVASALRLLRDQHGEPSYIASITEAVAKLYGISTELRRLAGAFNTPQYHSSLYRIERDVQLVYRSLSLTLEVALTMAHRTRDSSQWMVWGDLDYRTRDVEGSDFLERLTWYQSYVQGLLDLLDGYPDERLVQLNNNVSGLLKSQEDAQSLGPSDRFIEPAATTPRPAITRPPLQRLTSSTRTHRQTYPTAVNNGYTDEGIPYAPDPPAPLQSPTFTSSSSQTLLSSHTSSYGYPPRHWAEEVSFGLAPRSIFRGVYQLNTETQCLGSTSPDARHALTADGSVAVAEITFVDNNSIVTFYQRPQDQRARMVFSAFDSRGREKLYSVPLTSLTVVRDRSVLNLFRASSRDGSFKRWATLKFIHYERMVLFFSMFVALKRQDLNETPDQLIDNPAEKQGENEHYGGVIRDSNKLHALRLLECPGSGAFRLEARPCRGNRDEVPIWTAFLTKYLEKRDEIFELQADRVTVTMIGLRPAPFMFISGYRLPQTHDGDYVLRFNSREDAREFITMWTTLCSRRSARRG